MHGIQWNLPYAEESENMVYSVGVKIFRHLAETVFPPLESVFCHGIPVVCRESPVLAEHREVIRGCSGLTVHVEQTRRTPCVNAETAYSDRNVSFEHNAVGMCVVACLAELAVKMVLYEVVEIDLLLVSGHKFGYFPVVIDRIFSPCEMIGSLVFLAQYTPCRIRHKPVFIG